jgi:hypothetical protein
MLRSIENTLLHDDIGSGFALPDASTFARDHVPHFSSSCSRYVTNSKSWSGRAGVGHGFPGLTVCSGFGSRVFGMSGEAR